MKHKLIAGLAVLAVAGAAAAMIQSLITVKWNGVTVTERGRVMDGTLYIPATDLAKAYKATVDFPKGSSVATITGEGAGMPRAGEEAVAGEWFVTNGVRIMFDNKIVFNNDRKTWDVTGKFRNATNKDMRVDLPYLMVHRLQEISTGQIVKNTEWYTIGDRGSAMLAPGEEAQFNVGFPGNIEFPGNIFDCKGIFEFGTSPNSYDHAKKFIVRVTWKE